MSYLPEINEDQRNKNIKKLIIQNKKLRQQIFVFEEQMNNIISSAAQQEKVKSSQLQMRKSLPIQKQSSTFQKSRQNLTKTYENVDEISKQEIDKLLETNSPLIETKIIPGFKEILQFLKAQNIKENAHYILKQEDDLKILKKELYKSRKEKQVITQFIKDKQEKLQKSNNQLISHINNLREQLNVTIKFNRETSSKITQLEREIRKYHLTLQQYKKISGLPQVKGVNQKDSNKNFAEMQKQVQNQIINIKNQITNIENIWKPKVDILDLQYYPLKKELAQKIAQENQLKKQETYQKTRILTMKDQSSILQQKQKQKLVKVSLKLQKQLQQYLKEEQQKIRKKEQYLKKHRPRDKDQKVYHQIITTQAKIAPNPENTQVETQRDDKNIVKLKNYLKKKNKQDKQIEANISQSLSFSENQRMQRSWSNNYQSDQEHNQVNLVKKRDETNKEKEIPRLLLKSIKIGTHDNQHQKSAY